MKFFVVHMFCSLLALAVHRTQKLFIFEELTNRTERFHA